MELYQKYREDFAQNLKLGAPIMIGQIGQVLVQTADNIMVGQLEDSAISLASVALANSIYILLIVLGMGVSFALPPLIAEAHALGKIESIATDFKHSLVLNISFAILAIVAIELTIPMMYSWNQNPEVVELAIPYLRISGYGMLPLMIFQSFRTFADGCSQTLPAMIAMLIANALNILLNYILIYGNFGAPKLGVQGAAIGTLIARIIMLILIMSIVYKWKDLWSYLQRTNYFQYQFSLFKRILRLGLPTSLQFFFEVFAFSLGSVLMAGWINENVQAAHHIAINLASLSYLICSGIAMAATIRVGNHFSTKNYAAIRNVGFSAIIQVILFMLLAGLTFFLFRNFLADLYTNDKEVMAIAAGLLIVAALFQLSDGIQVVAIGALRGMQDVFIPSIISFIAYWVIALPASYFLAFNMKLGGAGIWLGLTIGLVISAILMTWRFDLLSKRI